LKALAPRPSTDLPAHGDEKIPMKIFSNPTTPWCPSVFVSTEKMIRRHLTKTRRRGGGDTLKALAPRPSTDLPAHGDEKNLMKIFSNPTTPWCPGVFVSTEKMIRRHLTKTRRRGVGDTLKHWHLGHQQTCQLMGMRKF